MGGSADKKVNPLRPNVLADPTIVPIAASRLEYSETLRSEELGIGGGIHWLFALALVWHVHVTLPQSEARGAVSMS